jgi:hypothetical protein
LRQTRVRFFTGCIFLPFISCLLDLLVAFGFIAHLLLSGRPIDPELRQFYRRKLVQKGLGKARVAAARKLGIRLWIMLRDQIDYQEFCRRGQMQRKSGAACAGMPGRRYGAKSNRLID